MKGDKAIYHTEVRAVAVEVEHVNEYGTVNIRALRGAPFTLVGSRYPYFKLQTDLWVCNVNELDFEDDRDWFEDQAAEDAEAEYRQSADHLDELDYANRHNPNW